MSPAVATTFILKCYEYCYSTDNNVILSNVQLLKSAVFGLSNMTDAELDFCIKFRSSEMVVNLPILTEIFLYNVLIDIIIRPTV